MKLILILIASLVFFGCQQRSDGPTAETHTHEEGTTYTCPMHPQVVQDAPGTCPVCGMDLVKTGATGAGSADLMLSESQMRLANVAVQRVEAEPMAQFMLLNARLAANEQRREVISSRAPGRIEKLFIRETGEPVRQGQPLYTLYSELLLTLQQEYLLAREQYESLGAQEPRYRRFMEAAEKKLLRYGLTETQVHKLTRNTLQPRVTLLSPASGITTTVDIAEGQYVDEGTRMFTVEDISTLWVEAELYPTETNLVRNGDEIMIIFPGADSEPVSARVSFLSPEFRNNTQISIMRAVVRNPENRWRPGQPVTVRLSHSARKTLSVPVDAVIRDGNGAHLYVQKGTNTFRPVMVRTGLETAERIEITEGLLQGDTVAVSGAYLLYSENVLKKGGDPMAGHDH